MLFISIVYTTVILILETVQTASFYKKYSICKRLDL